jgi:hypothetical protein
LRIDRIVRIEAPGPGRCTDCGVPLIDYGAIDGAAYRDLDGRWMCLTCAAANRPDQPARQAAPSVGAAS